MNPILRIFIGAVLFVLLLIAVDVYVGWSELLTPWLLLSPVTIVIALIFTFATYMARAMRIYDYFYQQLKGRFAPCLRLSLQHGLLNNFLPMRSGEISFPLLMSRQFDISAKHSVPALLWFRIMDIHTLLLLGLVSLMQPQLGNAITVILAVAWLAVPWLLLVGSRRLQQGISNRQGRVFELLIKLLHSLPHDRIKFYKTWAWTVLNWFIKLAVFAFILMQFIELPGAAALLGVIAGDLTSVLPVHGFAGAGTYEAGIVAAVLPFGADASDALKAAVNLHIFMLGGTILGGLVSLLLPARK